jgi:hypothetical protein
MLEDVLCVFPPPIQANVGKVGYLDNGDISLSSHLEINLPPIKDVRDSKKLKTP